MKKKSNLKSKMIYRVSRKISGGQGFGEIEVNRRSTEGIRAVKVLCRISHGGGLCHGTSSPLACTSSRVDPSVTCGLRVIMRHQYRLTNCKRCTTLVGTLIKDKIASSPHLFFF